MRNLLALLLLCLCASPTFGAVAYRASASTGYSSSAASAVVTKPTGTAADDILLAWLYQEDSIRAVTVTPPSGWTLLMTSTVGTLARVQVYWLRAGGSEPSNYTWSWTGNGGRTGTIAAFSGCETSGNPYDGTPAHAEQTTFGAFPAVSVTTTVANTLLVYGCGNYDTGATTPPTGFTERIDSGGIAVSDKAQAAAGSSGSVNSTSTPSGQSSTLIALKPPGGGGGGATLFRRRNDGRSRTGSRSVACDVDRVRVYA